MNTTTGVGGCCGVIEPIPLCETILIDSNGVPQDGSECLIVSCGGSFGIWVIPSAGCGYREKAAFFSTVDLDLREEKQHLFLQSTQEVYCHPWAYWWNIKAGQLSKSGEYVHKCSTKAFVRIPLSVTPGTLKMKGTRVVSSKFVCLLHPDIYGTELYYHIAPTTFFNDKNVNLAGESVMQSLVKSFR